MTVATAMADEDGQDDTKHRGNKVKPNTGSLAAKPPVARRQQEELFSAEIEPNFRISECEL